METDVARSEVEFLVVAGVVGDVHLAILTRNGTVLLQYDGRIMVQPCSTTFKQ